MSLHGHAANGARSACSVRSVPSHRQSLRCSMPTTSRSPSGSQPRPPGSSSSSSTTSSVPSGASRCTFSPHMSENHSAPSRHRGHSGRCRSVQIVVASMVPPRLVAGRCVRPSGRRGSVACSPGRGPAGGPPPPTRGNVRARTARGDPHPRPLHRAHRAVRGRAARRPGRRGREGRAARHRRHRPLGRAWRSTACRRSTRRATGASGASPSTSRTPEGRTSCGVWPPTCDVFIQNFRPGAIDRLGLG